MRLLSSLRSRIFLASAAVALAGAALALRLVSAELEATIDRDLQAGLERSERLLLEQHRSQLETLATLARLVADLPRLKAAVETRDAPTVEPLAREYQAYVGADLLQLTDREGQGLARLGPVAPARGAIEEALGGRENNSLVSEPAGLFEVVSVPVSVGPRPGDVLGTLSVGLALGHLMEPLGTLRTLAALAGWARGTRAQRSWAHLSVVTDHEPTADCRDRATTERPHGSLDEEAGGAVPESRGRKKGRARPEPTAASSKLAQPNPGWYLSLIHISEPTRPY